MPAAALAGNGLQRTFDRLAERTRHAGRPGEVLVADSFYCTYWLVAACQARGVQVLMNNHHKRDDHPAGARRLNRRERVVVWGRPQRPDWMSAEEYAQQPPRIPDPAGRR